MEVIGFSQATTSLVTLFGPVCTMLGNAICGHLIAKHQISVYVIIYSAQFMLIVGVFMLSLCTILPSLAKYIFWISVTVLVFFPEGLSSPAASAAFVQRMNALHLGSLFAILGLISGLGAIAGNYIAMAVIYPRTGTRGWGASGVFWGCAIILAVSLVTKVLIHIFKILPDER